jgi:hypothetical protein
MLVYLIAHELEGRDRVLACTALGSIAQYLPARQDPGKRSVLDMIEARAKVRQLRSVNGAGE